MKTSISPRQNPPFADADKESTISFGNKIRRILTGMILSCLATWSVSVSAQGTFKIGFEEYALGTTPTFVRKNDEFGSHPSVVNVSAFPFIQPHEGQKALYIPGSIMMASPDAQLIKEFSLYLYMPVHSGRIFFWAGNVPGRQEEVGQWQRLSGTFDPPVQEFQIEGTYQSGEFFPGDFAIDTVELMTIPEPSTSWLLGLGLFTGIFWWRQRPTGFTPSEATEGIKRSPTSGISSSNR